MKDTISDSWICSRNSFSIFQFITRMKLDIQKIVALYSINKSVLITFSYPPIYLHLVNISVSEFIFGIELRPRGQVANERKCLFQFSIQCELW